MLMVAVPTWTACDVRSVRVLCPPREALKPRALLPVLPSLLQKPGAMEILEARPDSPLDVLGGFIWELGLQCGCQLRAVARAVEQHEEAARHRFLNANGCMQQRCRLGAGQQLVAAAGARLGTL